MSLNFSVGAGSRAFVGGSAGASASASSGGGSGGGMGVGGYMALLSAFSSAADSYYGAKVAKSEQRIQAQRLGFQFQQGQIAFKSSMLQQQHNLTLQQFELSAASFALKSQAVQFDIAAWGDKYKASMSEINARQAERDAQGALLQGERAIGALTMAAGQEKSNTKASQAARGIVLGEGSAGEVVASLDLMKETDVMTIDVNRTHAANQKRFEKVAFQNEADFAKVSAIINQSQASAAIGQAGLSDGLAGVAGQTASQIGAMAANINTTDVPDFVTRTNRISAGRAGLSSLISSGSQVAASWYLNKRQVPGF